MKKKQHANEMYLIDDCVPVASATGDRLTAVLWKAGANCHFTICGTGPDMGVPDNAFRPRDVEDLARLTAVMSYAMHLDGDVGAELADDLGCLAHCLNEAFRMDLNCLVPRLEKLW